MKRFSRGLQFGSGGQVSRHGARTILFMANCISAQCDNKNISDIKRVGPGIITGRFVSRLAIFHFRWNFADVDRGDMRPAGEIFDDLSVGG